MKREHLNEIKEHIRRQHERDLESLLDYIERAVSVDEDSIEETPKTEL